MGEAKRRKKLDPNYGKSNTVDFDTMFSNLLRGETLLLCSRIEDESEHGGDTFFEVKISEIAEDDKQSNIKLAYEIATQANIIKLGIRRQHEQGRGLLNFMDEKYRKLTGLYTPSDGSGIVFNWYTIAEIKNFQRGSALSAILLALAIGCNTTYQFPCLFSGVPLDENATSRCHLLFVANYSNISPSKINVFVASENFI